MKKIFKYLLALGITTIALSSSSYADSNLVVDQSEVEIGGTFTVTVHIDSVAAWNVHVSTEGPVDNCEIVEADVTEDAENTTKDFSVICATNATGTALVSLSGDYTTANGVTTLLDETTNVVIKPEGSGDDPTDPDDPTNPDDPTDPDDPTNPDGPTDPDAPIDPEPSPSDPDAPNTGFATKDHSIEAYGVFAASIVVAIAVISRFFHHKKR